ncbi:MAG TPA: hypothetical protein PKL65_00695 [Bacteroidales bacterium]|nr:hypothetical protein [Bacteroidales bacterium]HNR40723.1 hypothetical protein [Bacteroidales bacterium]
MKKIIYVVATCLLFAGCEKYAPEQDSQDIEKRMLSGPETILKENLDLAAQILVEVMQEEAVANEISVLYNDDRSFWMLSFEDLFNEAKSSSFSVLRERFLDKCAVTGTKGTWQDLANFLARNGAYIYCPYPSSFYPKGTRVVTVAAHPIDNDKEGAGYRFEGKIVQRVTVNERYADASPVILIMPPDEKESGTLSADILTADLAKGDPVYEVKIGKIRCANYCGGLFEGELELRISRGYPEFNMSTGATVGKFTTIIPVNYPRSYAKSAINNWTSHSEGGWYTVNIPWDTNWKKEKVEQAILVYEYDNVKETSVNATVGYKPSETSTTVTVAVKAVYNGDFLGLVEWERHWYLKTNNSPGLYDEVKDGLTVRKTCPKLKLTTPLRIIY